MVEERYRANVWGSQGHVGTSSGPGFPPWERMPESNGSHHVLQAFQAPVLVPGPHLEAGLSPVAGEQTKAGTEIGSQTHLTPNFVLCPDFSAGGKYFISVVALGNQSRPWEGRPSREFSEGEGQRQGPWRQAGVQRASFAHRAPSHPEWPGSKGRGGWF